MAGFCTTPTLRQLRQSPFAKPSHDGFANKNAARACTRFAFACSVASIVFLGITFAALAAPTFPELTGRIVDAANLLSLEDKVRIETELALLEGTSSDQLVVVTVPTLQGYPIEDYGYQLGRHWGIGQKGTNNGVLLIVAPADRKVRIEVGYGLGGQLTDLMSKLIIENAILPEFRRGNFAGGVTAGVRDIKDVLLGDAAEVEARNKRRPVDTGDREEIIALLVIIGIIALMLYLHDQDSQRGRSNTASAEGRRRRDRRRVIVVPGGGGFGGGWSGGRSGGGGGFGGGGASGGW